MPKEPPAKSLSLRHVGPSGQGLYEVRLELVLTKAPKTGGSRGYRLKFWGLRLGFGLESPGLLALGRFSLF